MVVFYAPCDIGVVVLDESYSIGISSVGNCVASMGKQNSKLGDPLWKVPFIFEYSATLYTEDP